MMRHYDAREYGRALSMALEALGAAAEERDRAIQVLLASRDGEEMVDALEIAAAATGKVDDGMAGLAEGRPPDEYMPLYGAFSLAMNHLVRQWPAEVAAYGFNVIGQDHDAALKTGEARRAMAEFFHWWGMFQIGFRLMERDRSDLTRPLRLSAAARRVIDKEDWVRTVRD